MKKTFPLSHKNGKVVLATVSGVATTKPSLIRFFDKSIEAIDIITTKSFQVLPNSGNREPIICEDNLGDWGNSVGLRNPGLECALKEIKKLREEGLNKWLNISISADNELDFITLFKAFDGLGDSIELNFSCPHAKKGFGASIGSDKEIAKQYVKRIDEETKDRESLLFVKLTPNVPNIGEIAKEVVKAGADGIVAINTYGPIVHIDPLSNKPILNNSLGGKGGMSGDWVFDKALEAIKSIREAIGDDVPLLGMGGVSDGERASKMIECGADSVGIGSALGRVKQKDWNEYLLSIKREAEAFLNKKAVPLHSRSLMRNEKAMEYRKHTVENITLHSQDTLILSLSGAVDNFKAGEFVFLWIPGVGEKPFSLAKASPLTFIIKKRGIFTSYIFSSLKKGDDIFIRGPYGDEVEAVEKKKALVICGGTGEAVAYPLSQKLKEKGIALSFLIGTSVDGNKGIMEEELSKLGEYKCISDMGKIARVLDYIPQEVERIGKEELAFYLIGPEIFMKKASSLIKEMGVESTDILLSMEKNTMCGVGLCGECSCGSALSCQHGTFFTLSFLEEENAI